MQHEPAPRRPWGLMLATSLVVVAVLAAAGFGALVLTDREDVASAGVVSGPEDAPSTPSTPRSGGVGVVSAGTLPAANDGTVDLRELVERSDGRGAGSEPPADADVVVDVAGGDFVLADADLEVTTDANGEPVIESGVATLDLPTVGALSNAVLDRPLRGAVGMATGAELEFLGAHLRPSETYLYADFGTQPFDLFLGFGDAYEGADGLPERISTPGTAGPAYLVVGIDGDYFYLSTPCPAMIDTGSGRAGSTTRNPYEDADAAAIPGVSLDLSDFDPGGCGIGWSAGGVIPFEPMLPGRVVDFGDDFAANVVIDGTVPVHVAASLDGEIFYRFHETHTAMRANGELDVGIAFLKGAAEVKLPAIRGTFGWEATDETVDLWLTATAGSTAGDGAPAEMLTDLAPLQGRVDIDGELHMVGLDVLGTSFIELAGEFSLDPRPVRTASSAPVEPVLAAEALARIDSTGITVTGQATASPLTAIDIDGAASLEMLIPFADPSESYLQIDGSLAIGGTTLGAEASLRIDRAGALAEGRLRVADMAAIAVTGWLGPEGFQLTGSADVTLPIGDLDRVAASIVDQTANAEVIAALNRDIDRRVDEIASGDRAKGTELRNTVAHFRGEFDNIASIRETIAYNDGLIAQIRRDKQADIDWHWALNDWDRFWDKGPHAIRQGAFIARIEALKVANSVQYGYIDVANSVVAGAQQAVLGLVGWDEELNASLALVTEAYLGTLAGNVVATVLNGADAVLDAFGIDGSAHGVVEFSVGTEGVSAFAELEWCRDGACEHLAGARVELAPSARVCAAILGVESCIGL